MIIYLDTNIVIYTVEQNPLFSTKARTRLATARAASDPLMISHLTQMECLVGPLKSGDSIIEADYFTFFGVTTILPVTAAVCMRAAQIRARYNFKPMDALQLAAAVEHGATVFLTADVRLNTFTDITVEVLR